MSNLGINISALANVVTPFSPVGKMAVGLENGEAKEEVFAPIEESPSLSGLGNKENDRVNEDDSGDKQPGQENAQSKSQAEKQQQQVDREIIRQLASRDREVRAHEQAHSSVGGQYAGSPSYTFEKGPDGVNYAVGGEVPISAPSTDDPEATLLAAEQIKRAALAPADPSPQDRRVAAHAAQTAVSARSEILQLKVLEQRENAEEARASQTARIEEKSSVLKEQEEQDAYQERQEALQQAARRSIQLNDQLMTGNNVEATNKSGNVFHQLA